MGYFSDKLVYCQQIAVLRDGNPVFSLPVEFEPQCAAVHPGQTEVAVGGKTVLLPYFIYLFICFLLDENSASFAIIFNSWIIEGYLMSCCWRCNMHMCH